MELVEFDDVAGRNAAGCTMKKIAIDNGAKLRQLAACRFPASDS